MGRRCVDVYKRPREGVNVRRGRRCDAEIKLLFWAPTLTSFTYYLEVFVLERMLPFRAPQAKIFGILDVFVLERMRGKRK